MEIFGYVCSPHCSSRAEAQGIDIPEYEGQRNVVERRHWRKVALGAAGIGAVVLLVVGVWFWYAWFGSHPRPVYVAHFDEAAHSGQSRLVGKRDLIVLHGARLSRHDVKHGKMIWSRELEKADPVPLATDATPFDLDEFPDGLAESSAELLVCGTNIWVARPGRVVRYNWATGNSERVVAALDPEAGFVRQGDELVFISVRDKAGPRIQRIQLASGTVSSNEIALPAHRFVAGTTLAGASTPGAGLPIGTPGANRGEPLDPARVAAEAQRLPLAGRLALPAVLAGNMSQERILEELESEESPVAARREPIVPQEYVSVFPQPSGDVQVAVRLLQRNVVSRQAMKDRPATSALDNVNVTESMEVANELLNDLQRMRGGERVFEDESRYLVTVRTRGTGADWTQEVVGRPVVFPLQTVNVVSAGKFQHVLDKHNSNHWQAALSFPFPPQAGGIPEGDPSRGLGPCVERDGTLYVFDPSVLAAFDLKTGNARWRLPTTGVTDLFFDDEGMLYVNTSTANPESVRFSRQIDISQAIRHVVMKIDPATGKPIWSRKPGAPIACVSGKFIYLLRVSDEGSGVFGRTFVGGNEASFLKIKRLHPDDGRILWEHLQQRSPLDVQFEQNSIQAVFTDEVQVLRFLSF
jgi:hypothetical protein